MKYDIGIQADTFGDLLEALRYVKEHLEELEANPAYPPPLGKETYACGGSHLDRTTWRVRLVKVE